MEVTKYIQEVDRVLGGVCLQWATGYEPARTLHIYRFMHYNNNKAGDYYGLLHFTSIISAIQVVRANIPILPFASLIPWPLHRFYINRFFIRKSLHLQRESKAADDLEKTFTNQ